MEHAITYSRSIRLIAAGFGSWESCNQKNKRCDRVIEVGVVIVIIVVVGIIVFVKIQTTMLVEANIKINDVIYM